MPVRPEQAVGLSPTRAECHTFHHRQIEIDAAHDRDDGEHAHHGEQVAAALLHPHANVQNVHCVQELLHGLRAIDAVPAVEERACAHIVHDLLAAHAHMRALRLPSALLDEEVERPVRSVRCNAEDLLRREFLPHCRRSRRQ